MIAFPWTLLDNSALSAEEAARCPKMAGRQQPRKWVQLPGKAALPALDRCVTVRENAINRVAMILVVVIALLMLTGILTGTTVAVQGNGGDAGSAAAMANSAAWWIIAGANACAVTVLAWFWWRRRSRRAETHHGGRSRRSPWQRLLIVAGILLLVAYAGYVFLRRWNPDEAWAARVIGEAVEVQVLLARYHQTNGEYPRSLKDLQGEYLEPTDFLSRHAVLPERRGVVLYPHWQAGLSVVCDGLCVGVVSRFARVSQHG